MKLILPAIMLFLSLATSFSNDVEVKILVERLSYCTGENLVMNFKITTGQEATSYLWTGPAGFSTIQRNPTIYGLKKENEGWYKIEVNTGAGASLDSIFIDVNEVKYQLLDPEEYFLCLQKEKTYTSGIVNTGSDPFTIDSISHDLLVGNDDKEVSLPELPITLNPGDTLTYTLSLKPTQYNYDSAHKVTYYYTSPCSGTIVSGFHIIRRYLIFELSSTYWNINPLDTTKVGLRSSVKSEGTYTFDLKIEYSKDEIEILPDSHLTIGEDYFIIHAKDILLKYSNDFIYFRLVPKKFSFKPFILTLESGYDSKNCINISGTEIKLYQFNSSYTGNNSLCEGDSLHLSIKTNYENDDFNYRWYSPSGETFNSRKLIIKNVKAEHIGEWYYEIYYNGETYKSNNIRTYLRKNNLRLDGIEGRNNVCIYDSINIHYNFGADHYNPVQIKSITLKSNYLFLDTLSFPAYITSKEPLDVGLKKYVTQSGIYYDTMVVEIDYPCQEFKFYPIEVIVNEIFDLNIFIPDTSLAESEFLSIPVYSYSDIKKDSIGFLNYRADISFNPELFEPDPFHNPYKLNESTHLLSLEYYSYVSADTVLIGEIKGKLKSGAAGKQLNFNFYDFVYDMICMEINLRDGDVYIQPAGVNDKKELSGSIIINNLTTFSTYPNPAKDYITIEINTPVPGPIQVHLLDLTGKIIFSGMIENPGALNKSFKEVIDIKDLAPATYFIKVITPSGVGVSKLIIE